MTTITLSQQFDQPKAKNKHTNDDQWRNVTCSRCGKTRWVINKIACVLCDDCRKKEREEKKRFTMMRYEERAKLWTIEKDPSGGFSFGSEFHSIDIYLAIQSDRIKCDVDRVYADGCVFKMRYKGYRYYRLDYGYINSLSSPSTTSLLKLLVEIKQDQ